MKQIETHTVTKETEPIWEIEIFNLTFGIYKTTEKWKKAKKIN